MVVMLGFGMVFGLSLGRCGCLTRALWKRLHRHCAPNTATILPPPHLPTFSVRNECTSWLSAAGKRHLHLYGTFALALPESHHGSRMLSLKSSMHPTRPRRHLHILLALLPFSCATESHHRSSSCPNTICLRPSRNGRKWQTAPLSDMPAEQR